MAASTHASQPQARFLKRIGDRRFPCVGAKSALAQGHLRFHDAGDLRCAAGDAGLLAQLQAFAARADAHASFLSFVALYPATPSLDEVGFEAALWQRLQALHELDAPDFRWDPSVSADPQSPDFSMSLGGRAFYVIGVHQGASRRARRFECAALVFNLHSQFEALREDGRYERLRKAIIERDLAFSGSRNPMLQRHGEGSEARQYSGRAVGPEWRCPFSASRRH
jgi:FPC/CPF motif-containing protein YcgG